MADLAGFQRQAPDGRWPIVRVQPSRRRAELARSSPCRPGRPDAIRRPAASKAQARRRRRGVRATGDFRAGRQVAKEKGAILQADGHLATVGVDLHGLGPCRRNPSRSSVPGRQNRPGRRPPPGAARPGPCRECPGRGPVSGDPRPPGGSPCRGAAGWPGPLEPGNDRGCSPPAPAAAPLRPPAGRLSRARWPRGSRRVGSVRSRSRRPRPRLASSRKTAAVSPATTGFRRHQRRSARSGSPAAP